MLSSRTPPIPWYAAIAWACYFPLQFIYRAFNSRVYAPTLGKYNQRKNIKKPFNKQSAEARNYNERIDECKSTLYGCYYWMYVMSFAFFVTFWVLAVNRLQQIPRERYPAQNQYFIGATLIAWCFGTFIMEPFFTWILGSTQFYQFLPYFYDYRLGETFKEIES